MSDFCRCTSRETARQAFIRIRCRRTPSARCRRPDWRQPAQVPSKLLAAGCLQPRCMSEPLRRLLAGAGMKPGQTNLKSKCRQARQTPEYSHGSCPRAPRAKQAWRNPYRPFRISCPRLGPGRTATMVDGVRKRSAGQTQEAQRAQAQSRTRATQMVACMGTGCCASSVSATPGWHDPNLSMTFSTLSRTAHRFVRRHAPFLRQHAAGHVAMETRVRPFRRCARPAVLYRVEVNVVDMP